MVLTRNVILSFFVVNIQLCPHKVAPPAKIMPRPFFHERGIACGTTCDKVLMSKMDTLNDLIIISHSYCVIFNAKWNASETPPYEQYCVRVMPPVEL